VEPLIVGGVQQEGRRAGPVHVPGVIGFGQASVLARHALTERMRRESRRTRLLEEQLRQRIPELSVNGPVPEYRLPNTLHIRFPGAPADAVMASITEATVSTGTTHGGRRDGLSQVLLAMGLGRATASIRFGLGRSTTEAEIRTAATRMAQGARHIRSLRGALARWNRGSLS
jgi:cysteine desulfurase